jgi:hypothetical protein
MIWQMFKILKEKIIYSYIVWFSVSRLKSELSNIAIIFQIPLRFQEHYLLYNSVNSLFNIGVEIFAVWAKNAPASIYFTVKMSLCFIWAPRREGVLGERMYKSTHSLTLALDRVEPSASRSGRFTSRERAPGAHWIGGLVGPRAVLVLAIDEHKC